MSLFEISSLAGYSPLPPGQRAGKPTAPSEPAKAQKAANNGAAAATAAAAAKPPSLPATGGPLPPPPSSAAWVKTDEDIVQYFQQHVGDAQAQAFFFCLTEADASPGSGADGAPAWERAAAEFYLRVVPEERVQHVPLHFIVSERQVVRVQTVTPTDATPLAEWARLKAAFLRLRELGFFGAFSLTKAFSLWRLNARRRILARRRRALERRLPLARPALQGPLLEGAALLERLRGARAAWVQPRHPLSLEEWAEQQGAWRQRRAQPEVEAAGRALVAAAEAACSAVEAEAEAQLASVRPSELQDRSGVDLYAVTSSARARSMQAIKAAKLARAEAYQQALLDREQLPRMLRMLDLRLAGLLAEAAAATVGGAAAALHGAAPGLLHGAGADGCQGEGQEALGAGAAGSSGSPVFLCSVVMAEDGGIELSPGEEEWAAAVEGEVVGSSLRMAGSVPALLALPAFERYQALLEAAAVAGGSSEASAADAEAPAPPTDQQRQARLGAEELAKLDGSFVGGSAQLRALLGASFREARRAAQQFAEHAAVHRFGAEFDAAGWAASHASGQEGEADLAAADALLRQLAGWQDALQGMPLALDAGLVRLDASALQARLLVVVASAHDQVGALLTRAATERCRRLLEETGRWTEVAAARPPELDGFLAWRAEVARLEEGAGRQVAAAAQVEAALALLERFIGRLAAADAVKRDDLREAAAQLPAELAAAAAWAEGQRVVHGAAVAQQAKGVAEEAVVLESELQAGLYVDVGSSAAEVMADLDLQRERMAQLRAQAEEAAAVGRELGGAGAGGEGEGEAGGDGVAWEVRDAEAALKRCTELWSLVAEAEELRDGVQSGEQSRHSQEGDGQRAQVASLQERLGALRGGNSGPPDGVWLRASTALLACHAALSPMP